MKCLKCGLPLSADDIFVMEYHELRVCDVCDAEEYHILVDYNGSEDLNQFLGKEVRKKICNECISGQYELESINYGNPVKALEGPKLIDLLLLALLFYTRSAPIFILCGVALALRYMDG